MTLFFSLKLLFSRAQRYKVGINSNINYFVPVTNKSKQYELQWVARVDICQNNEKTNIYKSSIQVQIFVFRYAKFVV
jgi:hypothetical protein